MWHISEYKEFDPTIRREDIDQWSGYLWDSKDQYDFLNFYYEKQFDGILPHGTITINDYKYVGYFATRVSNSSDVVSAYRRLKIFKSRDKFISHIESVKAIIDEVNSFLNTKPEADKNDLYGPYKDENFKKYRALTELDQYWRLYKVYSDLSESGAGLLEDMLYSVHDKYDGFKFKFVQFGYFGTPPRMGFNVLMYIPENVDIVQRVQDYHMGGGMFLRNDRGFPYGTFDSIASIFDIKPQYHISSYLRPEFQSLGVICVVNFSKKS